MIRNDDSYEYSLYITIAQRRYFFNSTPIPEYLGRDIGRSSKPDAQTERHNSSADVQTIKKDMVLFCFSNISNTYKYFVWFLSQTKMNSLTMMFLFSVYRYKYDFVCSCCLYPHGCLFSISTFSNVVDFLWRIGFIGNSNPKVL